MGLNSSSTSMAQQLELPGMIVYRRRNHGHWAVSKEQGDAPESHPAILFWVTNLHRHTIAVINTGFKSLFLGHLLKDDLINPVKMSVHRTYVRTYVRTSTMKHNAATNQIVVFVKVNETFTTIWLSGSSDQGQGQEMTWVPYLDYFLLYCRHN